MVRGLLEPKYMIDFTGKEQRNIGLFPCSIFYEKDLLGIFLDPKDIDSPRPRNLKSLHFYFTPFLAFLQIYKKKIRP